MNDLNDKLNLSANHGQAPNLAKAGSLPIYHLLILSDTLQSYFMHALHTGCACNCTAKRVGNCMALAQDCLYSHRLPF